MSRVLEDRPLLVYCGAPLIFLSSLNVFIPHADEILGLVTANTLITRTYVWNLLSASFFETSVAKLGVDVFLLFGLSKVVSVDSLEQFLLYFIFNLLACTLGTSMYCLGRFIFSGHDDALIIPLYGFNGVLMALVMFARRLERNRAVLPQIPQVTYQNLPVVFFGIQVALYLVGLRNVTRDLLFSSISLLFSWSYLRFYFKFEDQDQAGTRGDDFSFVAMFPDMTHIVLTPFTTAFYNIMALLGIFPALDVTERRPTHHLRTTASSPKEDVENSLAVPSTAVDLVGERRRAKAMKLLDAKMAELAREPEGWDDAPGVSAESGEISFELSKLKV